MFKKFGKTPKKKGKFSPEPLSAEEEFRRIRLPRDTETLGIVERRLGSSRMSVRCLDGKTRLCRIPGKLKKSLWVRENNLVVVKPWEFEGDKKGDVVYKYRPNQVDILKKRGLLKELTTAEEF